MGPPAGNCTSKSMIQESLWPETWCGGEVSFGELKNDGLH